MVSCNDNLSPAVSWFFFFSSSVPAKPGNSTSTADSLRVTSPLHGDPQAEAAPKVASTPLPDWLWAFVRPPRMYCVCVQDCLEGCNTLTGFISTPCSLFQPKVYSHKQHMQLFLNYSLCTYFLFFWLLLNIMMSNLIICTPHVLGSNQANTSNSFISMVKLHHLTFSSF